MIDRLAELLRASLRTARPDQRGGPARDELEVLARTWP